MKNTPLVILGLDTGDFEKIQQWAAEGYLPTIASIMDRGSWGQTGGPELICEYGLSLTMFSGISRADHGYYYFRQLERGTYDLKNVMPREVPAAPFWRQLRPYNQKAFVMDIPDIEPVPGLQGAQIADWGTHHGSKEEPLTEPAELLTDVQRIFGPRIIVHSDPGRGASHDKQVLRDLIKRVEKKGDLCAQLLERDEYDLTAIFFCDSDPASHYFWRYRPEAALTHSAYEDDQELRHAVRDIYQAIDRQFGRLLQDLPDEANVAIVSLYGVQDEYPTGTLIESFLHELGYHVPAEKEQQKATFSPLALARKLLPQSMRHALSRYLPAAAQENLLAGQLRDTTDWSRTKAFAVPSLYTSFVYANLRGREPQGIVEPGIEYETLLAEIEADLMQLIDPVTGERAVRKVSKTRELFGLNVPQVLPDLFVEWEPVPHFMERVDHPQATLVQPRPHYCPDSQEQLTGFFALAGPSVAAKGNIGRIEVLDLAPTFLGLMGHGAPLEMTGKPRTDLLQPFIETEQGKE